VSSEAAAESGVSHASDRELKRDLAGFDQMARKIGGHSVRRQTIVNFIIFFLVVTTFAVSTRIPEGRYTWLKIDFKWLALDLGVVLISVKLAYFFHNTLKLNHYMFWAHVSLDQKLLSLEGKINTLTEEVARLNGADHASPAGAAATGPPSA
jgi:hypothetical protein